MSMSFSLSASQIEMWMCFPDMLISFPVAEVSVKNETILVILIFSVQPSKGPILSRGISKIFPVSFTLQNLYLSLQDDANILVFIIAGLLYSTW